MKLITVLCSLQRRHRGRCAGEMAGRNELNLLAVCRLSNCYGLKLPATSASAGKGEGSNNQKEKENFSLVHGILSRSILNRAVKSVRRGVLPGGEIPTSRKRGEKWGTQPHRAAKCAVLFE